MDPGAFAASTECGAATVYVADLVTLKWPQTLACVSEKVSI
jgi:hypothetical protein